MRADPAGSAVAGGIALLERAISYTLGSLRSVTPERLGHPTPCGTWNVATLLWHLDDSLAALCEAIDTGHVALDTRAVHRARDPVGQLRTRAGQLLGAWAGSTGYPSISIGGCLVTAGIVTSSGALELAVHGWDVARACRDGRPVPPALAEELLDLAPLLVSAADRPARFGVPVELPPHAPPGDRLVAFLGRDPYR